MDRTCRMNPPKTAPKAGRNNVCFLFRAVRTECANPTEYRAKASRRRITCMVSQYSTWLAAASGSPAVIDRRYSLCSVSVGALYERPRCLFRAKPCNNDPIAMTSVDLYVGVIQFIVLL